MFYDQVGFADCKYFLVLILYCKSRIATLGNVVYKNKNMQAGNTAIGIRERPKGIYFVKVVGRWEGLYGEGGG